MINGWIIGGVLFVSAVVIKGVAGYIEIKEFENELKKWRAYVDCIKNHINELQERSALRKQKALEEIDWQEQNIHIFKNTHIVMDLTNVQSIEKNNGRYVVYMNNGSTKWLNFNEGNGIMEQFAKYKTKNNLI